MNTLLEKQSETEKILAGYDIMGCNASEDLTTVTMQFCFVPKIYQERCTAYISIENPAAGVNEMVECPWNYGNYFLQTEIPRADGYRYSFLLVSENGYEEQMLDVGDYFTDLDSHMRFRLGKEEPKRTQLERGESTPWDISNTVYTYNIPIYAPIIYPVSMGYVPFRDIVITLRLNDAVIWQASYRKAFEDHAGKHILSIEPLGPEISVELPELAEGDRLTLALTAESYTDQTYFTLLDDLTVTNSLSTAG